MDARKYLRATGTALLAVVLLAGLIGSGAHRHDVAAGKVCQTCQAQQAQALDTPAAGLPEALAPAAWQLPTATQDLPAEPETGLSHSRAPPA